MYNNIPTDAECAFWLVSLIIIAGLLLALAILNHHARVATTQIDDVDGWLRNYDKIQRRR